MQACPVHTQAGRYVKLIAQGRYEDAYSYARAPNPFASTTRFAGLLSRSKLPAALLGMAILLTGARVAAQVSPAEIRKPELRQLQTTYLPQLKELHQIVSSRSFPFPFVLSRYVGLDPQQLPGTDTRGVEFVRFHERVVLKTSGNYNAAYNADLLTQNQRASRAFREVMLAILQQVTQIIPPDVNCDAVGFEISYHVRRQTRGSDYEGKEILVVVLDRADAFGFHHTASVGEQQDILNRSEIYLNGQEFGLALGERDPLNVEVLAKPASGRPVPATAPAARSGTRTQVSGVTENVSPALRRLGAPAGATESRPTPPSGTSGPDPPRSSAPAATPADADRLQAKYQSQLEALAKAGVAGLSFLDYAPPSLVIFRNQAVLQLTLRNPLRLEKDTSSIYKRAAQSFDLFLAPQLKALLEKIPADEEIQGLDITLLNQLAAKPNPTSEAVEFICPLKSLHQFVGAEITNQELINQSVVLVNGVRIALNLQLVE